MTMGAGARREGAGRNRSGRKSGQDGRARENRRGKEPAERLQGSRRVQKQGSVGGGVETVGGDAGRKRAEQSWRTGFPKRSTRAHTAHNGEKDGGTKARRALPQRADRKNAMLTCSVARCHECCHVWNARRPTRVEQEQQQARMAANGSTNRTEDGGGGNPYAGAPMMPDTLCVELLCP